MQGIIANRNNYGSQRPKSAIEYLIIHYTANKGDTAVNNCRYYQRNLKAEGKNVASAHYFIDDEGVVQSVYDNYVAYSVGGSKWNNDGGRLYGKAKNYNSLSFELCGDKTGKASQKTIENALKLVRSKMKEYNIPKERVIRHYDVTGKPCPLYWVDEMPWREEFWNRLDEPTYKSGKYKLQADSYLRSYPLAVSAFRVKYDDLSVLLKAKCQKDSNGYAVFLKNKTFKLLYEVKDNSNNIWGRLSSGYYLPLKYNGKERI